MSDFKCGWSSVLVGRLRVEICVERMTPNGAQEYLAIERTPLKRDRRCQLAEVIECDPTLTVRQVFY